MDALWSVMNVDNNYPDTKGKVLAHATHVIIDNCKFITNEKARLKVIEKQSRNVHAYIEGNLREIYVHKDRYNFQVIFEEVARTKNGFTLDELKAAEKITYNPYKYKTFYNKKTLAPVLGANKVWFRTSGEVYSISQPLPNSVVNKCITWC